MASQTNIYYTKQGALMVIRNCLGLLKQLAYLEKEIQKIEKAAIDNCLDVDLRHLIEIQINKKLD